MANYRKSESLEWAREHLRGQWSTLMTPFTPDDELDETGLRNNIQRVISLGTHGAGFTWGMGEFWTLTQEERKRIYEIASDESNGSWPIAAHVSHTSYKEVVELATYAEHVGFDLLVLAAPYFVTNKEDQVIEWVKLISESTNLAIMFYNSPQFGIVMTPQGLSKICDIPNVVGVKEASFNPEISVESHMQLGHKAIISTPDEWIFNKGKELGFQQQVMFANTSDWRFDSVSNNNYVQFVEKAVLGNIDSNLYEKKIAPIKKVSDKWWQYTVKKMNGALPAAMCKAWAEHVGMASGHVRAPLVNLNEEEKHNLLNDIREAKNSCN